MVQPLSSSARVKAKLLWDLAAVTAAWLAAVRPRSFYFGMMD
jgi:hypothetical protein